MKNIDRYRKGRIELTEEFLNTEYNVLKKTRNQIAKETGYSSSCIEQNLKKFGISKEKRHLDIFNRLSKEDLEQLYIIEDLSTYDISEKFNISQNTVERKINQFKIQIKDTSVSIIGQKIDRLEVMSFYDKIKSGKKIKERYLCKCSCGKIKICLKQRLLDGRNTSCGCGNDSGKLNRKWEGCGEISGTFFKSIQKGAKKRNLYFNITIEQIWDLFLKQNRKCALTNRELGFDCNAKYKASLDRIDSNKGYTIDNVWWLHSKVNTIKWDLDINDFFEICSEVVKYKLENKI